MDRLAAIEAFVAVAEAGSFSRAAEKLTMAKSAISRQVSALETELGARLFHRTTRSLTLTEVGSGYLERASRILADLEEANLAVTQLQSAPRGRLRINAPMSFGFLHLAQALPDFLAQHEEVTVDLMMNDRFVDLVEEGFDVAVRIGAMEDSSLVARKLAPIHLLVCASPDYLSKYGTPTTIAELKQHQCLGYLGHQTEWPFVDRTGKAITVPIQGRLTANNGDALRVAALKGAGLVYLPSFLIGDDLRSGALVPITLDAKPKSLTLSAVYPHARHLSPKVRAFVDFLVQRFGPKPYWDEGVGSS